MEIYLGADHNGLELKNELRSWLEAQGHNVTDIGPTELDAGDDYPDYGYQVAQAVAKNPTGSRGVLVCGSGVGMAVVANKVPGIRAAVIHDPDIARAAQRDDDINILALGASYIASNQAKQVLSAWLNTPFSQAERHVRRIGKITGYEEQHLK